MNSRFWGIVIIVVVIGGIVIGVKDSSTKYTNTNTSAVGSTIAPETIVSDISSVPAATLDTIGQGTASTLPSAINAPALTESQKPEIFYEGAEYCPYCATERWAMAVALSRFGSFTGLRVTKSSSTDVYPSTNTLSFYKSTYTSQYLAFDPVEIYTNIPDGGGYTPLQTPTPAENDLTDKYDTSGSIPFIDFGGKYVVSGATYNPQVLSGKSWAQIAGSLADPSNTTAKGVDGAANMLTATTCSLTNNQPATACDAVVQQLESKLKP